MGILKGAMTGRRYRVEGELPEGFRGPWIEALNRGAFQEPFSASHRDETTGWVRPDNLLLTDFSDIGSWLFEPYAHFALRMDKKILPANLLKAKLRLAEEEWCGENQQRNCPASVRIELREALEVEMLTRCQPRVRVYEVLWQLHEGWLLFEGRSRHANEVFLKRFYQDFGRELSPVNPLDWLEDEPLRFALERTGASEFNESPAEVLHA